MIRLNRWIFAATAILALNAFADTPAGDSSADKAWTEVQTAMRPAQPKEWKPSHQWRLNKKHSPVRPFLKLLI
jgi:hypothetical protein